MEDVDFCHLNIANQTRNFIWHQINSLHAIIYIECKDKNAFIVTLHNRQQMFVNHIHCKYG